MRETKFKNTEIGKIPKDWEVKLFENTFKMLSTNTFSRDNLNYFEGELKNVHYGDVLIKFNHFVDLDDQSVPYINRQINVKNALLKKGDLIIADTAEDETVGKAVEVIGSEKYNGVAGLHTILCRSLDDDFKEKYLGYFINSKIFHNQLLQYMTGIKVTSISKKDINSTYVVIPPKKEQEKIATYLSDVDELIDKLTKLIEKKKLIKKGTMQELLTGKKRLKGFTKKWSLIRFENIYEFAKEGGTPSTQNKNYYYNGNIPFIKIDDLYTKYIIKGNDYITDSGLKNSSAWLIPKDSIILSNGATIGEVSINKISICTKQGILGIILNKQYYNEYMYYLFKSENFKEKIFTVTTHGTMDAAYLKDLNNIEIELPELGEQKAIANILSNMDTEIEKLEKKLSKYKKIKLAMMDELLTGKTRLV